jgi:hypothetical protein
VPSPLAIKGVPSEQISIRHQEEYIKVKFFMLPLGELHVKQAVQRGIWVSSSSSSYITTDGQSANLSWCRAPLSDQRPIFLYRIEVKVTLRLTVSQLICLGIEYPCGTCDQILFNLSCLYVCLGTDCTENTVPVVVYGRCLVTTVA